MLGWAKDLFPIPRSITGDGVRKTLAYIQNLIPELVVKEVPSGTNAFDWTVPDEWNVRDAYIKDDHGNKIADFHLNNLHLVGYSEPVDMQIDLKELDKHLHSLPEQPTAIPYVTSYYETQWGFCITHQQRKALKPGQYHVVIDAELNRGVLNYGELVLKGKSSKEIFLSTYICHPSMANNELSGPVVTTALAQWLSKYRDRRYTYRIIFVPETIGSIVYLSKHLNYLKEHVIAGFNITCVGDNRCYSFVPSRDGNTLSDKVAQHVLSHIDPQYKKYSWLDRGSDERQYCSPGVDLPIATIMRSKYGEYPEYHTSMDNLELISDDGLYGSYAALQESITIIEQNYNYQVTTICEPQFGKRGLYPTLSSKGSAEAVKTMMDFVSYCDGKHSLLEISEIMSVQFRNLELIAKELVKHALLQQRQ